MLKSILAQCLAHQGIADIEDVAPVVLVRAVDAIGPHVLIVAIEPLSVAVVEEPEHLGHPVAQPVSRARGESRRVGCSRAQVETAPLRVGPGYNPYPMQHLVHDGSGPLVRRVGPDAHPSAIGAFGGGRAGVVSDIRREVLHLGEVVPPVDGGLGGIRYPLVGIGITAGSDMERDLSLWQGIETYHVAIAHLPSLRHGISPHVVERGGFQVFQPVDIAVVAQDA